MRLNKENRMQGLIDGDYCLKVAHDMLEIFNQEELKNEGFNSLEMLTIKSLFDDIFKNTIKDNYKDGRGDVVNLLSKLDDYDFQEESPTNVINLFDSLK